MNRISIDVTAEQHQRLKALAAIQGKSIKQFVLESTLGAHGGDDLAVLETLLDTRIAEAKELQKGGPKTVGDIFKDARRKHAGDSLNG